jgi:hypothetical protein
MAVVYCRRWINLRSRGIPTIPIIFAACAKRLCAVWNRRSVGQWLLFMAARHSRRGDGGCEEF